MATKNAPRTADERDKTACFLLLRVFFVQFWLLQFFGKIFDQESHIVAWHNLSIWASHTTEWFVKQTPLPAWLVRPYTSLIPIVELALGALLLIGLETRRTLIFSALYLISLDAGLLFQLKHDIVALNTIYLLTILVAIRWEPYNRWTLDEFLGAKND